MTTKLFYVPGTCSLHPHILLREMGADFKLDEVDRKTKISKDGVDYNKLNPKSYVPCIETETGPLTENVAIAMYLSEQPGGEKISPRAKADRIRMLEWLVYVSTELHKSYGPLFRKSPDTAFRENLAKRMALVEKHLETNEFLMGDTFTAADAYLFTVLRWSPRVEVTLPTNIQKYFDRISKRPAVHKAMEVEGLL